MNRTDHVASISATLRKLTSQLAQLKHGPHCEAGGLYTTDGKRTRIAPCICGFRHDAKAVLRKAMAFAASKYGRHAEGCELWPDGEPTEVINARTGERHDGRCTCGLNEIRRGGKR